MQKQLKTSNIYDLYSDRINKSYGASSNGEHELIKQRMIERYKSLSKHINVDNSDFDSIGNEEYLQCRAVLQSLFSQPIRVNKRVYLKWDNVNYYVPIPVSFKNRTI